MTTSHLVNLFYSQIRRLQYADWLIPSTMKLIRSNIIASSCRALVAFYIIRYLIECYSFVDGRTPFLELEVVLGGIHKFGIADEVARRQGAVHRHLIEDIILHDCRLVARDIPISFLRKTFIGTVPSVVERVVIDFRRWRGSVPMTEIQAFFCTINDVVIKGRIQGLCSNKHDISIDIRKHIPAYRIIDFCPSLTYSISTA
jgi:hypothetical protein